MMRRSRIALAGSILACMCALLAAAPGIAGAQPLPLGTLTLTSTSDPTCPAGHTCQGFTVSCPGVQSAARGFLATAPAQATARGLVVLATGGGGTEWWGHTTLGEDLVAQVRQEGFVVVQLRWVDAWLTSDSGEDAGSAHLACRPATVFKWVHDNEYLPLGISNLALGACGFCISGNSGGASQVSYALSHYGLESILDAVVPTSGPPHAAQAKGCLEDPAQQAYWYGGAANTIDSSYGFQPGTGPCALHDPSFMPRWQAESVDTGGSDYFHPTTRVQIILGEQDQGSAPPHARDYAARLAAAGSPYTGLELIPGMGHPIQQSPDGIAALHAALLADASTPRACGTATVSAPYERPRSACELATSLVPIFRQCGAGASQPNAAHAPPLARPACRPPEPSGVAELGPAGSGTAKLSVVVGNPVVAGDEADVNVAVELSDVRAGDPAGPDYDPDPSGPDLTMLVRVRLTDQSNGSSGNDPATTVDSDFAAPVNCTGNTEPTSGSLCQVNTSADALVPGLIVEGKATVVQAFRVRVTDAGADGIRGNGDDRLFAQQGVFVP